MDHLSKIQERLKGELQRMNDIIRTSLHTPNELMNKVVTGYLVAKGKQIRPLTVLLSSGLFGKITEQALYAGAALEMLHNASLIHDDVVDETMLRRGLPTVNMEWGNQIAVLAGDYFVSQALAVGLRTGNLAIVTALSDLGRELSLGEIDQITNVREHHFDEESYFNMIRQKTASLFLNCAKMGAEAAGASPEEYAPLLEYAELLGLCFQIKDDIFDYFDSKEIGKPTGNDLREGKVTLPLLYALANAPKDESDRMKVMLMDEALSDENISTLIEFAKHNGGIEYAYVRMNEMKRRGHEILNVYPDCSAKHGLLDLFEFIIARDK